MIDIAVRSVAARFRDDAAHVDAAQSIPVEHLDAIAGLGLYGAFAPLDAGGLELSLGDIANAVEVLASGCLASTFVWIQHFRLLASALDPDASTWLRERSSDIIRGAHRGGVALGGQLPGPPRLRASKTSQGWSLDGEAPWVSGWGRVDTLVVAARGPNETVVTVLLDAADQPGVTVERRELSAVNATATVRLLFEGVDIDASREVSRTPYDPTREPPEGLRVNGSLALGIVRRCCEQLGSTQLDAELDSCREELNGADATSMADARARACELAVRSAHALSVQRGSSSVIAHDLAERTTREAALLLTFGSRPAIRESLLRRFGASR